MGKLHELLAVEADIRGEYNRVLEETKVTFNKKPNLFSGMHRSLVMFEEDRKREESAGEQHQKIEDTVPSKLEYTLKTVSRKIDHYLQKESTNQVSVADIVIDGFIFGGDKKGSELPGTFLLGMETLLKEVREVIEASPTLAPGIRWETAPDQGPFVFRASHDEESLRTEKLLRWKETAPATKEHKAQVETWKDDVPVGKYKLEKFSGMISSAQKSKLLARVDTLLQETKKARQRANMTDCVKRTLGDEVMNYILGALKD